MWNNNGRDKILKYSSVLKFYKFNLGEKNLDKELNMLGFLIGWKPGNSKHLYESYTDIPKHQILRRMKKIMHVHVSTRTDVCMILNMKKKRTKNTKSRRGTIEKMRRGNDTLKYRWAWRAIIAYKMFCKAIDWPNLAQIICGPK